ncbi:MAG: hypothetical protein ACM3Q2_19070 [Syntrophothermus sp.]
MKSSSRLKHSIILLFFTFLASSCATDSLLQPTSEKYPPNNHNSKESLNKKRKKIPWPAYIIDSCYEKVYFDTTKNQVTPFSLYGCDYLRIPGNVVHHYEPKPGKILGIWNLVLTQNELNLLKTKYGYSGLLITDLTTYALAKDIIHYNPENFMVNIRCEIVGCTEWKTAIDKMPAGSYYVGESVEHGCFGNSRRMYNPGDFIEIKNYLNSNNRSSSLLITDGYKRCMHLQTIAIYSDKMMYSSYKNWNYWSGINCPNTNMSWGLTSESAYLPGSFDQRDSWTEMRNIFGNKFSRTWINSNEISEFLDLFGHARNLGIDQVWVYNFLDENGNSSYRSDQYSSISQAAYINGYLKQFVENVWVIYKCTYPNPCENCDPTYMDDWQLDHIEYTGTIYENPL